MGDATPLSDDERRELEELRAQRRAREEAERARAEREELERLRAERAIVDAKQNSPLEVMRDEHANVTSATAKRPTSQEDLRAQAARERGRKLMEPGDDLSMPLGQKLVLLAVFLAVVGFAIAIAFSRT